ncbi:MAG: hypothetical protein ACOC47_04805, partial [Alkalispirochaetaceae bacterium]
MAIDQLLSRLSTHQGALIIYFALIPVVAFALSFFHSVYGGRRPPWNGLYALLTYMAAVPAAVIATGTGYLILTEVRILGELGFLPTYLPLISFLLTSLIVKRAVDFYYVPWMLNPVGMLILMILTLSGGLYIYHTERFLIFGQPMLTLLVVAIGAFVILRVILSAIFGK